LKLTSDKKEKMLEKMKNSLIVWKNDGRGGSKSRESGNNNG
jgi:hypothetical protein